MRASMRERREGPGMVLILRAILIQTFRRYDVENQGERDACRRRKVADEKQHGVLRRLRQSGVVWVC